MSDKIIIRTVQDDKDRLAVLQAQWMKKCILKIKPVEIVKIIKKY